MQALRKSIVQQPTPPVEPAEPAARPAGDRRAPRLPVDQAAALSPALGLREHLTARLEELAIHAAPGEAAAVSEPTVAKLPVPGRAAVIVGLSLTLWLALYLAVAAIL